MCKSVSKSITLSLSQNLSVRDITRLKASQQVSQSVGLSQGVARQRAIKSSCDQQRNPSVVPSVGKYQVLIITNCSRICNPISFLVKLKSPEALK